MDFWGSGGSGSYDGYNNDPELDEQNEFLQENEQAANEWQEFNRKDSLIYLVDCSELMHVKDDEGYSWLMKTIQTIIESVKTKIIVEPKDHVGIVFFNTRESRNNNSFPGIYVLFPCDELRADYIRQISQLRSPIEFEKQIGSARSRAQETELYRALWVCSDIFQTKRDFIKRIFLFTANDDPTRNRADLVSLTVQKFTDLSDLGIEIHLFPLDPGFLSDEITDSKSSVSPDASVKPDGGISSTLSTISSAPVTSSSLQSLDSTVKSESQGSQTTITSSSGVKSELLPTTNKKPDYSTGIVGGFNLAKFYARVLLDEGDYVSDFVYRIKDQMSNLLTSVKSKMFKKRSLGTLEFRLGKDDQAGLIGVKLYCNVREFKVEPSVRIDAVTNEPLKTETQWICPATGAKLDPDASTTWTPSNRGQSDDIDTVSTESSSVSEFKSTKDSQDDLVNVMQVFNGMPKMKKFFPYAGQRIPVTDDEMRQIKLFGDPRLTLLGFKNEDAIKIQYNLKAPYFLYPDDVGFPGSNVSFVALVQAMARLRKVAIARLIARRNAAPRLVALLPQLERIDETTGAQIDAFGLHMIFLPFADEIRRLTLPAAPAAPVELIDAAKDMISNLTLPYKDRSWIGQTRNPVVQRHYDVLQAIALNAPMPSQIEDQLQPIPQLFEKKEAVASIDDFFKGVESVAGIDTAAAPRKKAGTTADPAAVAAGPVDFSIWPVDTEALKQKTIPELKEYLKNFKLPVSGTKDVLVNRVFNHMTVSKQ